MQLQINERQKEIKNHGSRNFPVRFSTENLLQYDRGSFFWHWHPEIELTLVISGQIDYQVGQTVHTLCAGQALFCNSNQLHTGRMHDFNDCIYMSVTFDPKIIYGYEDSLIHQKYVRPLLHLGSLTSMIFSETVPWQKAVLSDMTELWHIHLTDENEYIKYSKLLQFRQSLQSQNSQDLQMHPTKNLQMKNHQTFQIQNTINSQVETNENICAKNNNDTGILTSQISATHKLHEKVPPYQQYNSDTFPAEMRIQQLLSHIWMLIYENLPENTLKPAPGTDTVSSDDYTHQQERLRQILSYIHEHYQEKITLDDVSAHINLCKSECCRFFKKHMNESIFDYILHYRIEQSLLLLQQTDATITQISEQVGFSNPSYFTKIFRQIIGTSPRNYQQHVQK